MGNLVAEMVVRKQQEQEGFLRAEEMGNLEKMLISQGDRICLSKSESLVHTPNQTETWLCNPPEDITQCTFCSRPGSCPRSLDLS